MKYDLLFIKNNKIERSKFFSNSYEIWEKFFLNYEIVPDSPDCAIQLDYFYDPAFVIDYNTKTLTAFYINDLATCLLIQYIATRYIQYGFTLQIHDTDHYIICSDHYILFDELIKPLKRGIMSKELTLFT